MCVVLCPKCLQIREGSKHHILPRRFFTPNNNSPLLFLCRDCHDEIEKLIPQHERLDRDEYFLIAEEFLKPAQQYGKVLQFVRRTK